jgi:hypothetical protein
VTIERHCVALDLDQVAEVLGLNDVVRGQPSLSTRTVNSRSSEVTYSFPVTLRVFLILPECVPDPVSLAPGGAVIPQSFLVLPERLP